MLLSNPFGSWPVCKDFSNIIWITGEISFLNSFKTMGLISSGPEALSVLRFANNFKIPFESMMISDMIGYLHLRFSGAISKIFLYIAGQDAKEIVVKKKKKKKKD